MLKPKAGMQVEYRTLEGDVLAAFVASADGERAALAVLGKDGKFFPVTSAMLGCHEGQSFFYEGCKPEVHHAGQVGGAKAVGVRGEGESLGGKTSHGHKGQAAR